MIVECRAEISKRVYDDYSKLHPEDLEDIGIEYQMKSGYHPAGYGHYGTSLAMEDDKYYICWRRAGSCD